jgi:hypothetical protein
MAAPPCLARTQHQQLVQETKRIFRQFPGPERFHNVLQRPRAHTHAITTLHTDPMTTVCKGSRCRAGHTRRRSSLHLLQQRSRGEAALPRADVRVAGVLLHARPLWQPQHLRRSAASAAVCANNRDSTAMTVTTQAAPRYREYRATLSLLEGSVLAFDLGR